jgi:hypothetical protein
LSGYLQKRQVAKVTKSSRLSQGISVFSAMQGGYLTICGKIPFHCCCVVGKGENTDSRGIR